MKHKKSLQIKTGTVYIDSGYDEVIIVGEYDGWFVGFSEYESTEGGDFYRYSKTGEFLDCGCNQPDCSLNLQHEKGEEPNNIIKFKARGR